MTEPTTEADIGRRSIERWLAQYGITTNDAELGGLLDGWRDAIEAEARAEAYTEAYDHGESDGAANALREAAARVRALTTASGTSYVHRAAVLAILDPEPGP